MKIGTGLRQAREAAGISVEEISKELESRGIKASKKTIYSWEGNNSQPTPYAFLYMCKRYGINNPGEYFNDEQTPLHIGQSNKQPPFYADLEDTYRAIVDATSEAVYKTQDQVKKDVQEQIIASSKVVAMQRPDDFEYNVIPFRLSDQAASAGHGMYLGPESFSIIRVKDAGLIDPKTMFGVPVSGNSMEPDFHDGDILVVQQNAEVHIGEIGLFTLGTEGYVKKMGIETLISINPKYKPIKIPRDEYFKCNGKVIDTLDPEDILDY